jgi:Uncharacterized conserved protein (DUF2304)
MSLRAHILVIAVTAATLFFILRLVRRHRLRAKYSVLWVSLGAGLAVLAAAPGLLDWFSDLVGIRTPALGFLLLAITFLLGLSLHFSWELSRLEDRTRRLAEDCALLNERQARDAAARASPPNSGSVPGNHDQPIRGEGPAEPAGSQFQPAQTRGPGTERQLPS